MVAAMSHYRGCHAQCPERPCHSKVHAHQCRSKDQPAHVTKEVLQRVRIEGGHGARCGPAVVPSVNMSEQ